MLEFICTHAPTGVVDFYLTQTRFDGHLRPWRGSSVDVLKAVHDVFPYDGCLILENRGGREAVATESTLSHRFCVWVAHFSPAGVSDQPVLPEPARSCPFSFFLASERATRTRSRLICSGYLCHENRVGASSKALIATSSVSTG